MTDSMNFGPEWLRNLSSDGSTSGGTGGGARYQLAEYRYGREEMLALYDKTLHPPNSLCSFATLYSEPTLAPLALQPTSEDERMWQPRAPPVGGVVRGRGGSLERGGRGSRGRGSYQPYGRSSGFESGGGWGNSEQSDWSPRKDFNTRSSSVDNWRRNRGDEDDGWRSNNPRMSEKWGRSTSWRDGDLADERGPQDRPRNWHDTTRINPQRRMWDTDDHLPEWATENLGEGGGTFDATGAFHGSDDETLDPKSANDVGAHRKESPLQKSVSQQNITQKTHPASLPSSQSALSLTKPQENNVKKEVIPTVNTSDKTNDTIIIQDIKEDKIISTSPSKLQKHEVSKKEKLGEPPNSNINVNGVSHEVSNNRVEEEFDRLQEDLVLKLVEETTKSPQINNVPQMGVGIATQPPPNLAPPPQDKWYYQDPQGDLQGPFVSTEMAEWFRAGYFTTSLLVRRQCDERFYMLGDLVNMCGGNPFQSTIRIAPLKQEPSKLTEQDLLQYQLMQTQMNLRQTRVFNQGEHWSALTPLQQRELLTQQMLTQPQMPPDLQYLQQPASNPLMHMITQMQQVNKTIPEKAPTSIPVPLDPIQALVQQMGGLHSLQSRLTGNSAISNNSGIPTGPVISGNGTIPTGPNLQSGPGGLPGLNLPTSLQSDSLPTNLQGLHNTIPPSGLSVTNIPGLPGSLPNNLPSKPPLSNVDPLVDNPINNLLRQFASKPQTQQRDSLWQQNQFVGNQTNPQWQQQQQEMPISIWDLQSPNIDANTNAAPDPKLNEEVVTKSKETKDKNKENKDQAKEDKKKKEQEEKLAKKEAEEKRKVELKKQDAEKKASEEKRKKDEERIKKELEKAKREAEEKRLRELEEKRKQKEQRKAEEEARKKAEELKKIEDEERERHEARERDEITRKQAEAAKLAHENHIKLAKAAPWSQSNTSHGTSLAEIQKAEREKRAEQAALLQQKIQQSQEPVLEKNIPPQFSWASKPILPRQVKSLAEIQAEEQERLAKQIAEARFAQQQKEKETVQTVAPGIWNGQNLTWANNSSHWSNSGCFWTDTNNASQKVPTKPAATTKTNATTITNQQKPVQKQTKTKIKKEEQPVVKPLSNNNPVTDEFMNWCTKALINLNSTVDIPTFISFLRDIESALDVREYCRDYLGDAPATYQFASQFLEKRRSFKPKNNTHKDDMCTPAPAITPSSHSDFQEVKAKGKKTKKSKMLKVDSRILGFNVTASHDRINVGDRDYVDN